MMTAPVLIVGAGPTGLCASILLSRHGVPSLVIERTPGTSRHPSAAGISTRTMALFRSWGIALGSPVLIEQVLLDYARRFRVAEVRYNTELADVQPYGEGLDLTFVDRPSGVSSHGRTRYAIVADDSAGPLRTKLGNLAGGLLREQFRIGRILLAGAAAHPLSRHGVEDINLGLADVHNLAWKLAAVVQGWGDAPLLETYADERRPVTGRSASRAADVWFERAGRPVFAHELWRERFVLLVSDNPLGEAWAACAYSVARDLELPFAAFRIGPEGDLRDPEGTWRRDYSIEADGAVLMRPDGHIAWRSRRWASNPIATITLALSHILGRETITPEWQAAS